MKGPKPGTKAFGDRAQQRYDKLVGKGNDAKQIEERQRQEKGAGIKRGTRGK